MGYADGFEAHTMPIGRIVEEEDDEEIDNKKRTQEIWIYI